MGSIKYLVFDVDNTLLDFDLSLMATQKAVAERIGYDFTEKYYLTDRDLMYKAWNEYGMTETGEAPSCCSASRSRILRTL